MCLGSNLHFIWLFRFENICRRQAIGVVFVIKCMCAMYKTDCCISNSLNLQWNYYWLNLVNWRFSQVTVTSTYKDLTLKLHIWHVIILSLKGFLVGSYGLTWVLKNPSRVSQIAILNSPLTVSSPTPGLFQKLRLSFSFISPENEK